MQVSLDGSPGVGGIKEALKFPGCGQFQPLAYLQGLAKAVELHGGRIHENTRVMSTEKTEVRLQQYPGPHLLARPNSNNRAGDLTGLGTPMIMPHPRGSEGAQTGAQVPVTLLRDAYGPLSVQQMLLHQRTPLPLRQALAADRLSADKHSRAQGIVVVDMVHPTLRAALSTCRSRQRMAKLSARPMLCWPPARPCTTTWPSTPGSTHTGPMLSASIYQRCKICAKQWVMSWLRSQDVLGLAICVLYMEVTYAAVGVSAFCQSKSGLCCIEARVASACARRP